MLSQEPLHGADIRAQSGLPIKKVYAALAMMEPQAMARQAGGTIYVAMREGPAKYQFEEE